MFITGAANPGNNLDASEVNAISVDIQEQVEIHKVLAAHHEAAARHHLEAAKHHAAGNKEEASMHELRAFEYFNLALEIEVIVKKSRTSK